MSPTQRTLEYCKEVGRKSGIVERFIKSKGFGHRSDLFNIIDIICLDKEKGIVGVQSTGTAHTQHIRKIVEEESQNTKDWLEYASLELISWRKIKKNRGGKLMIYKPRIVDFYLQDGEIKYTERKL